MQRRPWLAAAAAFRSVAIPLVSALATLLSTGAAYGVMVAVFQWGWLGTGIDNGTTARLPRCCSCWAGRPGGSPASAPHHHPPQAPRRNVAL